MRSGCAAEQPEQVGGSPHHDTPVEASATTTPSVASIAHLHQGAPACQGCCMRRINLADPQRWSSSVMFTSTKYETFHAYTGFLAAPLSYCMCMQAAAGDAQASNGQREQFAELYKRKAGPHRPWMSSVSRKRCRPNTSSYGWSAVSLIFELAAALKEPTMAPALLTAAFWSSWSRSTCAHTPGVDQGSLSRGRRAAGGLLASTCSDPRAHPRPNHLAATGVHEV